MGQEFSSQENSVFPKLRKWNPSRRPGLKQEILCSTIFIYNFSEVDSPVLISNSKVVLEPVYLLSLLYIFRSCTDGTIIMRSSNPQSIGSRSQFVKIKG